jgi:hypothetical protein
LQGLLLGALPLCICAGSADLPEESSINDHPAAGYYERCGDRIGVTCSGQLQCVIFGSNETGLCLPECESDDDCPVAGGRSRCDVELGDGTWACTLDCTFARCPFGTTCEAEGIRNICADW